ncbi:MAG: Hpt domain-containing protein [Gammaproteobacteria bacterium]|jgi:chemosensory pili system protein ChpA (sensor histidine kinase/response regulator)
MQEAIDFNALNWVRQELGECLKQARLHLEAYAADSGDPARLHDCAACLHEARGPLQMVELKGADRLATEMEEVIADLLQDNVAAVETAIEALLQAFLQLPDYLSQLHSGSLDIPAALLPVINSLRQARGAELLQERMVFTPDLYRPVPESVFNIRTAPLGLDVAGMARAARIRFQSGLLDWYRGADRTAGLRALAKVLVHLRRNAGRETVARLWWVGAALASALAEGALEESAEIKRLFGELDRQIKRLIDSGEAVFADTLTDGLLKDMLYQLAAAAACPGLVEDVRSHYRLAALRPAGADADAAGAALGGFSWELLQTVSVTVRGDLELIRERLNSYARSSTRDPADLFPLADALHALGNTLGMMGMDKQEAVIAEQERVLRTAAASTGRLDDSALMTLANTLLAMEGVLEDMDCGRDWAAVPEEAAYRQGLAAVIKELIVALTSAKEAVNLFFWRPDDYGTLEPVPALLKQVQSGLQMAGEQRAAAATARIETFIASELLDKRAVLEDSQLDTLADAICSIEYYVEGLDGSPAHGDVALDIAESSLGSLGVPAAAKVDSGAHTDAPAAEPLHTATEPRQSVPDSPVITKLQVMDAAADAEILEVFIEEASAEVSSLAEQVPVWAENSTDTAVLETIIRSFHTLKGGGRMVGALALGEFAWAFENLLNQVIAGSISAHEELIELVQQCVPALAQLLAQVRGEQDALSADVNALAARAWSLADPQAAATGVSEEDSLLDIFSRECRNHLDAIETYLAAGPAPREVTEPLYRALHTLAGISESAGVDSVWILASVLDGYFDECYHSQVPVGPEALALLGESARELARLAEQLPDLSYDEESLSALCQRISSLPRGLSADAGEMTEPDSGIAAENAEAARPPDGTAAEVPPVEAVEQAHGQEPAPPSRADPYADVDPELLEIFVEEAAELLDNSETTLRAWSGDPKNEEMMAEFKRQLHTLKGGARMVDIGAIGDLSHTIESLLTRVSDGHTGLSEYLFATLNESIDQLAGMLEQVRERRQPEAAAELEAVINGLGMDDDDGVPGGSAAAEPAAEEDLEAPPEGGDAHGSTYPGPEAVPASVVQGGQETPEAQEQEEVRESPEVGEHVEVRKEADAGQRPEVREKPETRKQPEQSGRPEQQVRPVEADTAPGPEAVKMPLNQVPPPASERRKASRIRGEQVRVQAELLDDMVNYAGEISIYRARMEQQVSDYRFNLGELDQTITRLRDQLRQLEIETETHILSRHEQETDSRNEEFDPLEMDRYSTLQQLSRSLLESISDLRSIQEMMGITTRESESLLLQQSRVSTDLQEGLMHSRMIRFAGLAPRLRRIVRQAARQLEKQVELKLEGADGEMDRTVIERIIAPLEHLLRNAVAHGIESPRQRSESGKPETGSITIDFTREGPEIVLRINDDGAGMNIAAIRERAIQQGLMQEDAAIADNDVIQFVLQTGFSTASEVTQIAGRGVGLDVVCSAVKQLGGSLHIDSLPGSGTAFTVRLPYTLALNQALLVRAGTEIFCIPLASVEGVVRASVRELMESYGREDRLFEYAGNQYRLKHLGCLLDTGGMDAGSPQSQEPVLLVRIGERRVALQVEAVMGSREIVVKPLGAQLSKVEGVSGATILGDGSVVMILDVAALSRMQAAVQLPAFAQPQEECRLVVMVVDDSITVRKVTTRLLERNGYKVQTARDGVDAMGQLQEGLPDIMLLDIEMPRMDGFELATHMRNDEHLQQVPIIIITSRTGEKHRHRAQQIGINDYLGKPYQESELLESIHRQIGITSGEAEA